MTGEKLPTGTSKSSCFRTIGITFIALLVLAIPALFWTFHMVMQVPRFRNFGECAEHIQAIGAALNRYDTKFDHYPASLTDLYPDFIPDRQILHCPNDTNKNDQTSYEYMRPAPDSPGSMIVVICKRHVLFKGQPAIFLAVSKNGDMVVKPAPMPTHTSATLHSR